MTREDIYTAYYQLLKLAAPDEVMQRFEGHRDRQLQHSSEHAAAEGSYHLYDDSDHVHTERAMAMPATPPKRICSNMAQHIKHFARQTAKRAHVMILKLGPPDNDKD